MPICCALVPSQEAHRQASSHAWTGTGPANTHTHTHTHLHSHCTVAAGTAISGFICVCVCVCFHFFLHFHRPQETNAEELGACEKTAQPSSHMENGTLFASNICVRLLFTLKSPIGNNFIPALSTHECCE